MEPEPARFVHATAVVIEEFGILIRGPSGSGKSSLALLLLTEADHRGRFARLVGDDRMSLRAFNGLVVARPHPAITGLLECRMLGLARFAFEPACVIRLVVDLAEGSTSVTRLPSAEDDMTSIDGVLLQRLSLMAQPGALACQLVFRKLFSP